MENVFKFSGLLVIEYLPYDYHCGGPWNNIISLKYKNPCLEKFILFFLIPLYLLAKLSLV